MSTTSLFYQFHFYLFGLIGIAAAITFVTRKSPVAAVLWLVVTMFALAALYIMLNAQFIGAIQVIVYAGAIMVVFLFVIMLLNLGHPNDVSDIRGRWGKLLGAAVGLALLAELLVLTRQHFPDVLPPEPALANTNVVAVVAQPLFHQYLLAFEVTSVLLLAALVGAVVLAKQRKPI
jgi:NADH-quinone oxidoreductase subunit J